MKFYQVEMIRLNYKGCDVDNPMEETVKSLFFQNKKDAVQTAKNIINNLLEDYDDRDEYGDGEFELIKDFDGNDFKAVISASYDVIIRINEIDLNYEAINYRLDVYQH